MRKAFIWISGASFLAAAVLAVIAINATGDAVAQDATTTTTVAVADGGDASDVLADLGNDLIDQLVADGVISEAKATDLRSGLAEAKAELDATDWDQVEAELRENVRRFQRQIAGADWDDIRNLLEGAIADFDWDSIELPDLSEVEGLEDLDLAGVEIPELNAESIPWDDLEEFFEELKLGIVQFDLDDALTELRSELDAIDWDDVASDIREELKGIDFGDFKEFTDWEPHDFEFDLDSDAWKKKLEGIDWDELKQQLEG